jgi:hypothetical protein
VKCNILYGSKTEIFHVKATKIKAIFLRTMRTYCWVDVMQIWLKYIMVFFVGKINFMTLKWMTKFDTKNLSHLVSRGALEWQKEIRDSYEKLLCNLKFKSVAVSLWVIGDSQCEKGGFGGIIV